MRETNAIRDNTPRKWAVFIVMVALLSALLWAGWSLVGHRPVVPGTTASSSGTITVGLRDAPASLDLRQEQGDAVGRALLGNVYETLIARDQNNALQPGLAERWSTSEDGLTLTLHLRGNMRFSNGDALDASDAVWSLQQIITGRLPGYEGLGNVSGVGNPDAGTVVITLSAPSPALPRALAGRAGVVYNQDADIDYATEALGSGPFVVADSAKGDNGALTSIDLERNTDYWGDKAASARVTLRYYADDAALAQAFKDGTADAIMPSDATTADGFKDSADATVAAGQTTDVKVLAFNNGNDSIFSDEQVRGAVRHLIDRNAIAGSRPDAGQPLGGPIAPLEPGYEDLTGLFPYDMAKARSMLSYFSAGYLGTMRLVVEAADQPLAQTIADQLSAGGLAVEVQTVASHDEYAARIEAKDYDMTLATARGEAGIAAFASSQSPYWFENADAQRTYAAAMAATNDQDYQSRLKEYARVVSQHSASDWLYAIETRVVTAKGISGMPANMTDVTLPLSQLRKA